MDEIVIKNTLYSKITRFKKIIFLYAKKKNKFWMSCFPDVIICNTFLTFVITAMMMYNSNNNSFDI